MNSTRNRLAVLASTFVAALLTPALTGEAAASDHVEGEGIDVVLPANPVPAGDPAEVIVTGLDLTGPATIELIDGDYDTIGETRITPSSPVAVVPLPTHTQGTFSYQIDVEELDGDAWAYADFDLVVTGRPTSVLASFAPWTAVRAGGQAGSTVEVQAADAGGSNWATIASTVTNEGGAYTTPVPTFWVGTHRLRVRVPATATTTGSVSEATGSVTVRRAHRLHGSNRHRMLYPAGYRWNPCQVIDYRLNPSRMPKNGPGVVAWVTNAISEETGLRFRYAGTTRYVPFSRKPGPFPHDTDIVLAWTTPAKVSHLRGDVAGVGGAGYTIGQHSLMEGGVALDATRSYGVQVSRQLVLHELGHVIGLGHVDDPKLVMNPTLSRPLAWWGRGDVAGLEKLGARGGCLPTPDLARTAAAETTRVVVR